MMKLERLSDWEARLSDYIADKREQQFQYGTHDCYCFSFGAIGAMVGYDCMPEFREKYNTEFGSLRVLKEIGQGSLEATIDHRLPTVDIGLAKRGDLAFFDGSVGVVIGAFAWFVGETCLERVPREFWDKCWRVG